MNNQSFDDDESSKAQRVPADNELTIPVIEENATIDVVEVEKSRVVIRKTVELKSELVNVPLREENVLLERKPMETYVEAVPPTRQEGNTTVYSVVKEVLVVEKRLMLIEEIHVTKRDTIDIYDERVELRQERVTVTREPFEDGHPG